MICEYYSQNDTLRALEAKRRKDVRPRSLLYKITHTTAQFWPEIKVREFKEPLLGSCSSCHGHF